MNQNKPRLYFENLNGLRFCAFLLLFLFQWFKSPHFNTHMSQTYYFIGNILLANTGLGVNFFFVLSGFLITYILVIEKDHYSKINIPIFYKRRALRIMPLFFFCVFSGFVLFPVMEGVINNKMHEKANVFLHILFLNNFDRNVVAPILAVLWPIAIGVQFYLVWPVFLSYIPTRRWGIVFVILITGSLFFGYNNHLPHHTVSYLADFVIGGAAAYLPLRSARFWSYVRDAPKLFWKLVYALTGILFFCYNQIPRENELLFILARVIVPILFAFVILEQTGARNALYQMWKCKIPTRLGKYSFGLYCLAPLGIWVADALVLLGNWYREKLQLPLLIIDFLLAFFITLFLAKLSYRFLEAPFLRRKEKFSRLRINPD